tara:strand:+ start:751 stop:1302 length:552 start_codon:yes stop_codon:yes gene_type:complete
MLSNVKETLTTFAEDVVKQSKENLVKLNKVASKELYNSIGYDLRVHQNSFSLSLLMEDYADFVDKGVKGVGGTKKYKDGKKLTSPEPWKLKTVTNGTFKYTNKRPPHTAFNGWVIRKGIAPRTVGGQFTSRRGLMFAIANSVYHTGLETTNFFTKPFESAFKDLPQDIIEAFGLDMNNIITDR